MPKASCGLVCTCKAGVSDLAAGCAFIIYLGTSYQRDYLAGHPCNHAGMLDWVLCCCFEASAS